MRFKHFVSMALTSWKMGIRQTYCLLAKPGVGKTSAGRALADAMTDEKRRNDPKAEEALIEVKDLTSSLPEDLGGLPFREGGSTIYAPQEWLKPFCEPDAYGVLVLDDLPAATPAVQVAARQLALERRIHGSKLGEGVVIVVTGNRREDKANASTLPAHFRNATMLLGMEVDAEDWFEWAGSQSDIDPVVPAFLRWKSSHLSKTPADADDQGAFATPRTWAMLGRSWPALVASDSQADGAMGLVGQGIAVEFLAFAKLRDSLVDPAKVLADPKKTIPQPRATLDTPDKVVACVTTMAELAAKRTAEAAKVKGRKGVEDAQATAKQLMQATAWVTSHNREYASMAISTYHSNGGSMEALVQAATVLRTSGDPEITALIGFMTKAFKR